MKQKPILVDILTPIQKTRLDALILLWTATTILFYIWWCQPTHILNWTTFLINTFVLLWPSIIPLYAFYFIRRMKKPNTELEVPKEWRVASITTKAPSEPWEVVRGTLLGILADNSVPHDTWLADEDPSEETIMWCKAHDVKMSCRRGVKEYHNLDFPRRTRCKEGNLAYFYDSWGYRDYDFVIQFDCDHVPTEGYLRNILVAFNDPKIGYVTAPSVCSRNADDSWTARGRLWAEATVHGAMQAGAHGKWWNPMCIGSHYAVRTAALKEVGGLGPELAEDHSTTLLLVAGGWRGVHAIDAIADGLGPITYKDGMMQEYQWSRSIFVCLLTLMPKHWRSLGTSAIQFLFSQLWYTLYALSVLGTILISPLALITKGSFMNLYFWDYFFLSLVPASLAMIIIFYLKRLNVLRPDNAKVVSWEVSMFTIARYPIVFWSIIDAINLTYFSHGRVWKVTPKKQEKSKRMLKKFYLPHLIILSLCVVVELTFSPTPNTFYYFIFNMMNIGTYGGFLALICILDKYEAARLIAKISVTHLTSEVASFAVSQ